MRMKLFIILLIMLFCASCPIAHAKVASGDAVETVTVPTTETEKPTGTPEPTETLEPTETPEPTVSPEPTEKPIETGGDIDTLSIGQLIKIFALGLCSGLGLVTILYMLGIAVGSFFAIAKIGSEER